MILGLLLVVAAAAVLATGADLFTDHASELGRRFGIPTVAIAVLLAGAEPEELLTSIVASVRDRPGFAAGDAVGASMTVLTLVLGTALVLGIGRIDPAVRGISWAAAALAAAAAVVLADGSVHRPEGAALAAAYVPFALAVTRRDRRPTEAPRVPTATTTATSRERGAGLAFLGIASMSAGGWFAVAGAERLVTALDRPDGAVGLTLLGLATSSELLALLWAARRHHAEQLLLSAVLGSVAFNVTLTLGAAALVHPVDDRAITGAAIVVAALTGLLAAACSLRWHELPRSAGGALLAIYVGFVAAALG